MKKTITALAAGIALGAALNAHGLFANAAVRVTPFMKTDATWDGAPIAYPAGDAEATGMVIEIAPGGETGWHLHTVPSFAYMIEGEIEVRLKDGRARRVVAGEGLAEVVNTLHNGRNLGDKPARLVVFYAGATRSTLTLSEAEAAIAAQ